MSYHKPVLLKESIEKLNIKPDGCYVDCTYGGGGHSKEILKNLSKKGKLFAFDQDADAQTNVIEDERLTLIPQNFRYLQNYLKFYKVKQVDGILADLGVSSHQFNVPKRGFSTRFEGPLDMRMNQQQQLTAQEVINSFSEEELADIFYQYGEVRGARKVASIIVSARKQENISSTQQLVELFSYIPQKQKNRFLAQVFQALRIYVNDELQALKELLQQSHKALQPKGILVVISYHSLEDRLVKRYLKTGLFEGEPQKDIYGNWFKPWQLPYTKAIVPTKEEIEENPRARSAKLRVGIKNNE